MTTRRKPRNNNVTETPMKSGKHQLIAIVAVTVTMAVVFAAVYVYTGDGGHAPYVPGQGDDLAPDFSLVDTEGNQFSLAQYRGNVVVLDFMGTTCEPCKTQIDNLKSVHASYAALGVKIFSIDVNSGDTNVYLQNYKLAQGATWPFAVDTAGGSIEYSVTSIPTVVIIGLEGQIVKRNVGVMSAAEISSIINPLLEG